MQMINRVFYQGCSQVCSWKYSTDIVSVPDSAPECNSLNMEMGHKDSHLRPARDALLQLLPSLQNSTWYISPPFTAETKDSIMIMILTGFFEETPIFPPSQTFCVTAANHSICFGLSFLAKNLHIKKSAQQPTSIVLIHVLNC